MTQRVLVIANETVGSETVHNLLRECDDRSEVLVVAPALNSRLAFWATDDRRARVAAEARLVGCLAGLDRSGASMRGMVGDADPLLAIEDALGSFAADRIVIVTHPPERSHWLARDVVNRARDRFDLPVSHLVAGAEVLAAA
jgi:GABA permease